MEFNDRLRNIRIERGLSQDEVAKRAGTTKQSISRYENSVNKPTITAAKNIADALGVSLEYLYNGQEKTPAISDGGRTEEFAKLFSQLNAEEKRQIIDLIKLFLSRR